MPQLAVLTLLDGHEGLYWSDKHHPHHHNWENGDGVACHPHYEQVHGNLLQWTQSDIPRFLRKRTNLTQDGSSPKVVCIYVSKCCDHSVETVFGATFSIRSVFASLVPTGS